jgi:Zn-dependent oligopeptidase
MKKLNYKCTSAEIQSHFAEIESEFGRSLQAFLECKSSDFYSTFKVFSEICGEASYYSIQCTLPALVSEDSEARCASAAAKEKLRQFFDALFTREDVFLALKRCPIDGLNNEQLYLRQLILNRFRRKGLDLPSSIEREAVAKLDSQIAQLEGAFETALNEDVTTIVLSLQELSGLTEPFLNSLPIAPDGTSRIVGMKAPTFIPVMSRALDRMVRQRVDMVNSSKCPENEARLAELCRLRHERAVQTDA